jgi:hypothetical protein
LASQTSKNIKILPRRGQDRIRRQHECHQKREVVHGLPARKDGAVVADNFGIYPKLKRGLMFKAVTLFRLGARSSPSPIEFCESG